MSELTIVMYHYVRDLRNSRFPAIKGRDLTEFKRQLEYLSLHYNVVTVEQILEACAGGRSLPERAAWLTFDDGYLDHYTCVLPLLRQRGWQGSFFPPVDAVSNGVILDVNKCHFILAAEPDPLRIIAVIRDYITAHQYRDDVNPFNEYWSNLFVPNRFDSGEVIFIKRVLQHALPADCRGELSDELFEQFVGIPQATFAREIYMDIDQVKMLVDCGMYVGSHGTRHLWLDRVNKSEMKNDIELSLVMLNEIGAPTKDWVMCYPYGAYSDDVLILLTEMNCALGITTNVGIADLGIDVPLELPRLDTNDIPFA